MKKQVFCITYNKQHFLCSGNFKAISHNEAVLAAYQSGAVAIVQIQEVR